eukprot:1293899-Pyramimonas_sp.AAC.1
MERARHAGAAVGAFGEAAHGAAKRVNSLELSAIGRSSVLLFPQQLRAQVPAAALLCKVRAGPARDHRGTAGREPRPTPDA